MAKARDTLPGLFAAGAAVAGPGGPLLIHDRHQLTYGDIDAQADRVVAVLVDAGVQSGDRVAVVAEKSPVVLPVYLATLRMGAIYLPLNPGYTDSEVEYVLDDAEPAAVIADPARAGVARRAAFTLDDAGAGTLADAAALNSPAGDRNVPTARSSRVVVKADDPAVLLYTSGTTGRPKGAVLTHGNLASNARTLRDAWGFRPEDRLLHALPIYHAHGLLVGVNVTLTTGSSMRWLARFIPGQVVDAIENATVFMGVPTYYRRLLADPRIDRQRCAPVRLFVSGSAPLPATLHTKWERRTGHRILERYGMTETGMIASNPLELRDGERRPGSVGRPLPGVEVRVVDGDTLLTRSAGEVGDVQVRGPNVFAGYWRRQEQTAAAFAPGGWFRTGDLGSLDTAGYLTLAGRSSELIITGGLNVYPKEVEDALDSTPLIVESAVVGLPDDDLGERVAAAVVGPPGQPVDVDAIRDDVRRRLAGYKTPKSVTRVEELPRNAMGKVDKARLRRLLLDGSAHAAEPARARPSSIGAPSPAPGSSPPPGAAPPPLPVSPPRPILPDYRGASIAGLVPALLAPPGLRPDWLPAPARHAPQVVLFVLDGLGWEQLRARRSLAPSLAAMDGGPITSVAPTTTATALSSIVTGTPPAVHGIVGYRIRVDGRVGAEVLNVLRWRTASGDARRLVPPREFSHAPAFCGQPVPVISREGFHGTGFTVAHQGDSPERSYTLPSGLAVEVGAALRSGVRFAYAYYEGIDKLAHARGFGPHFDAEVANADRLVADICAVLPPGAALVVTADHGQVHVGSNMRTLAPEVTEAAALVSGEARFCWLHAHPGRAPELLAAAERSCGNEAWVATADDLLSDGWFGAPFDPSLRDRLGDVAVVAHHEVGYRRPDDRTEGGLVCRHGSLTADEALVPLLARER